MGYLHRNNEANIHNLTLVTMYETSTAQKWLETNVYPFESIYLTTDYDKLHLIDEGKEDVILFVQR